MSGSFKVVLPNGLFFEANVTCLAVEDNIGWVAGTCTDVEFCDETSILLPRLEVTDGNVQLR